jgi:hypothetical protein
MALSDDQREALCEYVDGRRAAGARWDEIEDAVAGMMTEEELGQLERWHKDWSRRRLYEARQRVAGDRRAGGESVAEVTVDWASPEAAALKLDLSAYAAAGDVVLDDRAVALAVVRYLHEGLLTARVRWRYHAMVRLAAGERVVRVKGPGRAVTVTGLERVWLTCAVLRMVGNDVVEAYPESRAWRQAEKDRAKKGMVGEYCRIDRRELDGEALSPKELSARLAAVLHTFLGGAGSRWRNNAELAKALGVSRQAVQVRKRKLLTKAGARTAEGLRSVRGLGE